MVKKYKIIVFFAIFYAALSLHFSKSTVQHLDVNNQLTTLRNQQSSFEKQIVGLIDDIKNIQLKVNASVNTNQKVIILQNAILSQRQKIAQLQNSIVPPFNLSKNACLELTNNQKIKMLDQLQKAKDQVAKLKSMAAKLPNNAEVTSINSDIAKQQIILEGIQKTISTQCDTTQVFTATIFQTNLFATNWILGKQTIDDIVEKYYQRSRLYHNVTNCPIGFPFFDGLKCTQCSQPTPIFNMQQSKCDKCPYDTKLNTDKHICQQILHFTDYKNLDNYILNGTTLPLAPSDGETPCPSLRPYFDGKCIKCALPNYWNVAENKCKDCPTGQVFNVNTKNCSVPQKATLTYLEGNSRWVTSPGNFTNILKERAEIVKNNPNNVTYCGKDSPYFDGIQCISCPFEFNLTVKKCTSAPAGQVYNPNLHTYVTAQAAKDTNPNATNLLAPTSLPQSNNSCYLKTPFYDGIACILCPDPFPLFDTTSKKCVKCNNFELYDAKSLKCVKRPTVFISSNFNDLVGSPKVNLTIYKAELLDKVKNNGDSIIKQCQPDEYSNYTNCFKCQQTQKFNIQTKKCDICNGTIDSTTLICDPLKTMLTNLDATNLIVGNNSNLSAYAQAQKKVTGPILKCPNETPYSVGGLKCIACSDASAPYFDLQSQKCINCPQKLFFNSVSHKCQKQIFITNVAAIKRFIQVDNYTVANVTKQLQNLSKIRKTSICVNVTPIATPQGDKCIACDNIDYYNLKTKQCVLGIYVTNTIALKATGKVIQADGNTIQTIQAQNTAIVQPKVSCPAEKPLWNGNNCTGCKATEYYYLKNSSCYQAKLINNFDTLQKSGKVVQIDGVTLKSQQDDIIKAGLPTVSCPVETPLSDGTKCISCPSDKYYNIKQKNCYTPQTVSNLDALTKSKRVVEDGIGTLTNLQVANAKAIIPKVCPQQTPLFNGSSCISCPNDQFYNLKTKLCYVPLKATNLNYLSTSKLYIQTDNYTLANVMALQSKNPYPTAACPELQPIWNGTTCTGCPSGNYYFLSNYTCFVPKQVTNVAFLTTNKNYLESGGVTLQQIDENIKKETLPVSICPDITPLFDGSKCMSCAVEQFYGLQKKVCLNVTVVSNTDALTLQNNYIESGNATLVNLAIDAKKVSQPKKVCPTDVPFYNGTNCISCKQSLYNIAGSQCANCASDFYYDTKTHSCVKKPDYIPNLNNSLWIVSSNAGLTKVSSLVNERSAINGSVKCPDDKPHFNNVTQICDSCASGTFWNYQTLICMSCGDGEQVDQNTRKCGKRVVGQFQTSLNSQRLLFDGIPKAQFQEDYNNNKQMYPQIQDCPNDKPYFDGFQCILCPPANPLFSLSTKLCSSCPPNSIYDETNKYCYNGKQLKTTKPTVGKMYSSIF